MKEHLKEICNQIRKDKNMILWRQEIIKDLPSFLKKKRKALIMICNRYWNSNGFEESFRRTNFK